jgi:hypothetical protein
MLGEAVESLFEVGADDIMDALAQQTSRSRAKRGALSVAKFKMIARLVWDRASGLDPAEWENRPAGSDTPG